MKRTASLIVQHLTWRGFYFFSVLILNILISRFFAAEKSGQIFYIVNNLAFILLLTGISLESGAVYYIASGQVNAFQMARFCLLWTLIAAGLAGTIWWVGFQSTATAFFSSDPTITGACYLYITGVLLTTYFNALFFSRKEFGLPNKILLAINAALIIFLIGEHTAEWVRKYFLPIYFSTYFLQGFLLMITFLLGYTDEKTPGIPASPQLKKLIRYSLTALTANALYFLVNRMDYWFVERYCSAGDLGNYIQASKLGQMLLIIPSILSATLFPLLAGGKYPLSGSPVTAVMRVLLWINLLFCMLIICGGSYLFPLIFGKSFDNMYVLFVLLIPGILAFTANFPIAVWFGANNRIGINVQCSLIALALIFTGDLLLLPHYGVVIASMVSSGAYISYFVFSLYRYRKTNPAELNDFLLIRKQDIRWIRDLMKQKISGIFSEKPFTA